MIIRRLSPIFLTLAALACRPPQPCGDGCDAAVDDSAEDPDLPADLPPPTDLPCGGADLMTDNLNCGSCGHVCKIQNLPEDLHPWDAGGSCKDGKCGSFWSLCLSDKYQTCRQVLEAAGFECGTDCNAKTPGTTVLYFDWEENPFGSCWNHAAPIEYSLGCDDPLPWNPDHAAETISCCAAQ